MADLSLGQAKVCSKCGVNKALSEFAKSKQTMSGVRAACKACSSEAEARRLRAKGILPLKIDMACEDCGALFTRTAPLRTRCDDCRDVHRKSQALAFSRLSYQRHPKRIRNPDERRAASQRYNAKHRSKVIAASRKYNDANRDDINRKSRERNRTAKRKDYMLKWDREYRSQPKQRLDQRMKTAVAVALKGGKAGRSWETLLGFTLNELMAHIERQFMPGMSWDNMGEWHIDHIVPKSSFEYSTAEDADFRAAWALTNLRPLWALENWSKGPKRLLLL